MKDNKGITLAVLVITIALLSIMSFVIISKTTNIETIDYAKKAELKVEVTTLKRKLKEKLLEEENQNISGTVSSILGVEGYDEKLEIVNGKLFSISQDEKEQQWFEEYGIETLDEVNN